jgi:hypothetical protein
MEATNVARAGRQIDTSQKRIVSGQRVVRREASMPGLRYAGEVDVLMEAADILHTHEPIMSRSTGATVKAGAAKVRRINV